MSTSLSNQTPDDPMGSETFASLWMALQNSYEGTNITRTVARLLHMYQPEDGLEAYERLLRTLYVLLGDFDSRGFKLLVSIIPPPANIPEDTIEAVFENAVGFPRMTVLPDSGFLDFGTDDESTNNLNKEPDAENTIPSPKSDFENKTDSLEVEESSQEFFEYPTETYVICNNYDTDKKEEDQHIPGTSSDYRMKWIYTPYSLRKNAICQSSQLYQENTKIPVIQKIPGSRLENYQQIEDSSNVFKKPELINIPKRRSLRREKKEDAKIKFVLAKKNDKKAVNEKQKAFIIEEETAISKKDEKLLRRKLKNLQRAIQEDIYKMDVVQPNSEEIEIIPVRRKKQKFVEPSNFDINNNLSQSIQNYLHRAKSGEAPKTVVEKVQIMTPSNNDPVSDETAAFINCWKKIITKSVLGRDPEPEDLYQNSVINSKEKNTSRKGKKETEKKVSRRKLSASKRLKVEKTSGRKRKCSNLQETDNLPLSLTSTERTSSLDCNNLESEESNTSSQVLICESNSGNRTQTPSVSELTNYKQEFCDSIMDSENAEVTSSNSFPSSLKENEYNQYYFNYLQREYELMEQQRNSIETQFLDDQTSSSISNQFESWTKFKSKNWSFPSFKQSQCPQHHLPVNTSTANSSVFNFVPEENISIEIIDCEEQEFNQLANDPNVIQQNLEDIFVVVKEPENVSIHQSSSQ